MTLAELARETLVEKNVRLQQEKCRHKEIYSSSVTSDWAYSTNRFCFDCGKSWHSSTPAPAKRIDDGTSSGKEE